MNSKELQIIRQALINEQMAISYYTIAANQANSPQVKEAFEQLVSEEKDHIDWLMELHNSVAGKGLDDFDPNSFDEPQAPVSYDESTIGRESGSLAVSVYGIGINLEQAAIAYYRDAAAKTKIPKAKALYEKLVRWESQHLNKFQVEFDRLKEEWWEEQGFSPA